MACHKASNSEEVIYNFGSCDRAWVEASHAFPRKLPDYVTARARARAVQKLPQDVTKVTPLYAGFGRYRCENSSLTQPDDAVAVRTASTLSILVSIVVLCILWLVLCIWYLVSCIWYLSGEWWGRNGLRSYLPLPFGICVCVCWNSWSFALFHHSLGLPSDVVFV